MRSPRSIRFADRVDEGVQDLARRTGRDVSAIVNEMLDEGLKMRRIPGIVFADSQSGRVARIAGTGLGVWEIIRALQELDNDRARVCDAFHWLADQQLRSALAYAEAYPEEIDARIQADEAWTPEGLWAAYPFMRPDAGA